MRERWRLQINRDSTAMVVEELCLFPALESMKRMMDRVFSPYVLFSLFPSNFFFFFFKDKAGPFFNYL